MTKLQFFQIALLCLAVTVFALFMLFFIHGFFLGRESAIHAIQKYYIPSTIIGMCVIIGFVLLALVAAIAIDGKEKELDSEGSCDPNAEKVTLNDIIIPDELRQELEIICNNMSEEKKKMLEKLAHKPSGGYIFYGPPGNGKTLLACAIAGETNGNFISVSATELITKYVGETAKNIRNLFKTARKKSPCIIFIDEIDAIGQNRSSDDGGYAQSNNQAVIELLTQMNDGKGNQRNKGVVVIAATNRLETLDKALIRKGRFIRKLRFLYQT